MQTKCRAWQNTQDGIEHATVPVSGRRFANTEHEATYWNQYVDFQFELPDWRVLLVATICAKIGGCSSERKREWGLERQEETCLQGRSKDSEILTQGVILLDMQPKNKPVVRANTMHATHIAFDMTRLGRSHTPWIFFWVLWWAWVWAPPQTLPPRLVSEQQFLLDCGSDSGVLTSYDKTLEVTDAS